MALRVLVKAPWVLATMSEGGSRVKLPRRTRREFCAQACQAVALAAVGGSLPGCGGSGGLTFSSAVPALMVVAATAASDAITLQIGAGSPLASVGGAALVDSSRGRFLVSRTGQDTFTALTAKCTHQGCTVTGFENQTFVCPCHGSRFDTGGRVTNGPASRALESFPTRFANDVLTITT
jgi:nitrite reductase/ring-hydroxylating ferredoxin subunit